MASTGLQILSGQWNTGTSFNLGEQATVEAAGSVTNQTQETLLVTIGLEIGGDEVATKAITMQSYETVEFTISQTVTFDSQGNISAKLTAGSAGYSSEFDLPSLSVGDGGFTGDVNLVRVNYTTDNNVSAGEFNVGVEGVVDNNTSSTISPTIEVVIDGTVIGTKSLSSISPGIEEGFNIFTSTAILEGGSYPVVVRALYGDGKVLTYELQDINVTADGSGGGDTGGSDGSQNLLQNPAVVLGGSIALGLAVSEALKRR